MTEPSRFDDETEIYRTRSMKTEESPEAEAVFLQKLSAAVSELKDRLRQDYEQTCPGLGEIIRIVIDEEEARAWDLSSFPHLLLPDLFDAHIATLGLELAESRHENVFAAAINAPHAVAAM